MTHGDEQPTPVHSRGGLIELPSRPADITPAWLSTALRSAFAGVSIVDVSVEAVGTGQTGATYRVTPTYASGADVLPATLIVKLPSQDPDVRQRVALGYRSEHAFYTEVASTVSIPTPRCYHVDIAHDGSEFVMVLADMAPAVQGDQITGCTAQEATLAVKALAGLHGPRWCDPAWLEFKGTVMPRPDRDIANGMGELARLATDTTLERLGARMSEADRETLNDCVPLIPAWLGIAPERYCLLHGDYRLDNLLFTVGGTGFAVVDWQTLAVGLPARDLSYFIGTSVQADNRQTLERDLVKAYHTALTGYGVENYSLEHCFDDYRVGTLQIPLITTLGFAFSAATERGDDMALVMLQRGCRAIRDLQSLDRIVDRTS